MQTDLSAFVPNVHFEQIPIKNLVSNQDYQRNLSISHVQKAAANFNLYQINPVKVSRREGKNYVFNGQHTIEIVVLNSENARRTVYPTTPQREPTISLENAIDCISAA